MARNTTKKGKKSPKILEKQAKTPVKPAVSVKKTTTKAASEKSKSKASPGLAAPVPSPVKRAVKPSIISESPAQKASPKPKTKIKPQTHAQPKSEQPRVEAQQAKHDRSSHDQSAHDHTMPDLEALTTNTAVLMEEMGRATAASMKPIEQGRTPSQPPEEISDMAKTFGLVVEQLVNDPQRLVLAQTSLTRDFMNLWAGTVKRMNGEESPPSIIPDPTDRRFKDPEWSSNPVFDFIKQDPISNSKLFPCIKRVLKVHGFLLLYLL